MPVLAGAALALATFACPAAAQEAAPAARKPVYRFAVPAAVQRLAAREAWQALRQAFPEGRLRASVLGIRGERDLGAHAGGDCRVEIIGTPSVIQSNIVRVDGRVLSAGQDRGGIVVFWRVSRLCRLPQAIPEGKTIDASGVEMVLVRAGDPVTVQLRTRNLAVITRGIARQDGRRGEWIRVENPRSGREFRAKVAGAGAVEVEEKTQ